jgi:hypothetical protein
MAGISVGASLQASTADLALGETNARDRVKFAQIYRQGKLGRQARDTLTAILRSGFCQRIRPRNVKAQSFCSS